MAELIAITPELRDRLKQTKVFNKSTVEQTEYSLLLAVFNSEESDLEDRLLAGRTLWNIAESQKAAVTKICENYKQQYLALEHKKNLDRQLNHFIEDITASNLSEEELLKVLKRAMEMKGL